MKYFLMLLIMNSVNTAFSQESINNTLVGNWSIIEKKGLKKISEVQLQFTNDSITLVVATYLESKEVWVTSEKYEAFNDTIFTKSLLFDNNEVLKIPIVSVSRRKFIYFDSEKNVEMKKARRIKFKKVYSENGKFHYELD